MTVIEFIQHKLEKNYLDVCEKAIVHRIHSVVVVVVVKDSNPC